MDPGSAIMMGFGWVGGIFVVIFLIRAFVLRYKLLPEEEGKKSLLTLFPLAINVKGMHYSGPFSRIAIYPEIIVIRGLRITTILRPSDISESPFIHKSWVILNANINGRTQKIKISTECNKRLVKELEQWREMHV